MRSFPFSAGDCVLLCTFTYGTNPVSLKILARHTFYHFHNSASWTISTRTNCTLQLTFYSAALFYVSLFNALSDTDLLMGAHWPQGR